MNSDALFAELLALRREPPVGEWYTKVKHIARQLDKPTAVRGLCRMLMCCTHACPSRLLAAFPRVSLYENVEQLGDTILPVYSPLFVLLNNNAADTVQARLAILRRHPPENIEITNGLSGFIVDLAIRTCIVDFVQFFLEYGLCVGAACRMLAVWDHMSPEQRQTRNAVLHLITPRLRANHPSHSFLCLALQVLHVHYMHINSFEACVEDIQFLLALAKLDPVFPPTTTSWQPMSRDNCAWDILAVALASGVTQTEIASVCSVVNRQLFSICTESPLVAAIALGDEQLAIRNALVSSRRSVWTDFSAISNWPVYEWTDLRHVMHCRNVICKTLAQPIDHIFHALSPTTRDLVRVAVNLKAQLERLELCAPLPRLPYEVWELIWQMLL